MKSKTALKAAWLRLASNPEFDDCLDDLLRYTRFWRPVSGEESDGEHRDANAKRSVITYILKQTDRETLEIDMSPPDRQ